MLCGDDGLFQKSVIDGNTNLFIVQNFHIHTHTSTKNETHEGVKWFFLLLEHTFLLLTLALDHFVDDKYGHLYSYNQFDMHTKWSNGALQTIFFD